MPSLTFTVSATPPAQPIDIAIDDLTIAGWAGRDPAAIEHHIAELAALGVRRPSATPCFYRLGAGLLTQSDRIEVVGAHSGGEAECVLLNTPDGLLVTVGSDHTDRAVEAYGVTVSKQVCPKPVARVAWRFAEVAPHWDRLELRAWLTQHGARRRYQAGSVAALLAPADLLARAPRETALPERGALYCGTLAVDGPLATMADGDAFEIELHDPVLERTLRHAYRVRVLEIAD
ncbi:DUF2848 domain-containing protein [Burkholderia sp. FERM BP-3421]|jgi:hypothetical protein|uniref:DUF2848 domain-containing protein n=1 Tax=Burkholderia sp. FERM BP-3421 TaxID=1494466 RepID=UPI00236250D7|nr:DUF2848 domain-containing protein [Burkholderia sp. FERM BP-3421]WDD93351.1 DUF2848 domain-containing protein [Burkholderia sp. FERM BP-3421]